VNERDDEDDRLNPLILDLSAFDPTTEAGRKGMQDALRGRRGRGQSGTHPWDEDEPKDEPIPSAPKKELDIVPGRQRGGITDRARAAANLKVDGFSYQEIAETLEFKDAREAKREVERVLALTHSTDDYETLRILAASRAEQRLRLSSIMAGTDFLIVTDDEGNEVRIPNDKKFQWHQQAGVDLMNWATITGAKAPTKIELNPDVEAMEALVSRIAAAAGHEDVLEAEVIDLDVVPDGPMTEEYGPVGEDDDDEEP
jgi:hypothetical protein